MRFSPLGKKMDFKPSQFVYLVIRKKGITREPHPYSIACGYNLGAEFKLGIKQVGDHTRTLDLLEEGDRVIVYGPYGRFSEKFLLAQRDCVFIGAGIGITPFIGMWHVALHSEDQYGIQELPEPDKDLAVLKIDAPKELLHPIIAGTSSDLQVGQKVFAIGKVQKPVLGVTIAEGHIVKSFGAEGVLIVTVAPGGGADEAGLRPTRRDVRGRIVLGDLIVGIDGEPVSGSKDLFRILDSHKIGDTVRLRVLRPDGEVDVNVKLQARP